MPKIEINEYSGGIILKEIITNISDKIKRKNIWSYNNITLEKILNSTKSNNMDRRYG